MRQERTVQATIFEVFAGHQIGCALKAISDWLDVQRALLSLVERSAARGAAPDRAVEAAGGNRIALCPAQAAPAQL
jgi:IS5 family transposase